MSHIPDDKRARRSADSLFRALVKCIRMNTDKIKNIRLLYDFGETAEEINDIFLKLTGRCFKDNINSIPNRMPLSPCSETNV